MGNIKRRIPRSHKPRVIAVGYGPRGLMWACLHPYRLRLAEAESPLEAIKLYFATFKD